LLSWAKIYGSVATGILKKRNRGSRFRIGIYGYPFLVSRHENGKFIFFGKQTVNLENEYGKNAEENGVGNESIKKILRIPVFHG